MGTIYKNRRTTVTVLKSTSDTVSNYLTQGLIVYLNRAFFLVWMDNSFTKYTIGKVIATECSCGG